jgi:ABC-type multidrug transport system ATPase subunit
VHRCEDDMMQKLEFDSINFGFGVHDLLSNIYMSCEAGSITGLLGRNGSGKTTLMKIVFGAIPYEGKSVRINDHFLGLDYLSENRIAYLPQKKLIPSYLSIGKALSLFKIDEEEITGIFPEAKTMIRQKPDELSGGYLRIFEILLILKSRPVFCLLDEPFSGLMPLHIDRIKAIMQAEKKHKGIIITDHLYRHVSDVADKLYLLANGQTYPIKDKDQLVSLGYLNAYE